MAISEEARYLLSAAVKDLRALQGMSDGSVFADEIFGFHAQQAVEKALREIREETGLTVINPCLQMITSETGSDPNYNWLLFIFRGAEFSGRIKDCNEGVLSWVPRQQVSDLRIPDVDRQLLPFILDDSQRYFVRLSYNDQHQVAEFQEFSLGCASDNC